MSPGLSPVSVAPVVSPPERILHDLLGSPVILTSVDLFKAAFEPLTKPCDEGTRNTATLGILPEYFPDSDY